MPPLWLRWYDLTAELRIQTINSLFVEKCMVQNTIEYLAGLPLLTHKISATELQKWITYFNKFPVEWLCRKPSFRPSIRLYSPNRWGGLSYCFCVLAPCVSTKSAMRNSNRCSKSSKITARERSFKFTRQIWYFSKYLSKEDLLKYHKIREIFLGKAVFFS